MISQKNFVTAWLLSLFVGVLGADRFYLGKVGSGIAKLLTFGGFGVWYLIDLVLLLTGQTKDNQGQELDGYGKSKSTAWVVSALLLGVVVVAGIAGSNAPSSAPQPTTTVTVTATPESSPSESETPVTEETAEQIEEPSESVTESATPEPTETPLEAKPFYIQATNDLNDLLKDIDDSWEDLSRGNSFQVLGNSIELVWNLTQLRSTLPPVEYQEGWSTVLDELEASIDLYRDAVSAWVSEEAFTQEVESALSEVEKRAKELNKFLDTVDY